MSVLLNSYTASGPSEITSMAAGSSVFADNASVTPTNPAHAAGDTLLCIATVRFTAAVLSVSGTGWGDAPGAPSSVNFLNGGELRLFKLDCTGSAHVNPTISVSGGGAGGTVAAFVIRITGRRVGSSFTVGTVSNNTSTNNTILFAQDSPSISPKDAIIAYGWKFNDGGTGSWNTLSGQTAGLTWTLLTNWDSAVGGDQSGGAIYAINTTGSNYTAGTAGSMTGQSLSVAAISGGAYIKVAAI